MQSGPDSRYLQVVSSPKHAWGYDLEDNEPVGRLAFDGNISDQDAVEYYVRLPMTNCPPVCHLSF